MIELPTDFLTGSYPPLVTPFRDGRVDHDAYARLIEHQIANGTHGIVVNGTTSEPTTLTMDERNALVRTAVEVAGGRIPVVAQTGAQSHAETCALTDFAQQSGADADDGADAVLHPPAAARRGRVFRGRRAAHRQAAADVSHPRSLGLQGRARHAVAHRRGRAALRRHQACARRPRLRHADDRASRARVPHLRRPRGVHVPDDGARRAGHDERGRERRAAARWPRCATRCAPATSPAAARCTSSSTS